MSIAEFNSSDGLPPLVVQKLNNNFRESNGGGGARTAVTRIIQADSDYLDLNNKPSIEGVTLIDDKLFPDLGIFKTSDQGYDVPDDYTLTNLDINDMWNSAVPI